MYWGMPLVSYEGTFEDPSDGKILLDSAIDTAVPFSNGDVTGSVGRHGSYRGDQLLVGPGTGCNEAGS
jgi:hypothetical protein